MSAFSHFAPGTTPLSVSHQGPFVATTFSFNLPAGKSLGNRGRGDSTYHERDARAGFDTRRLCRNAQVFQKSVNSIPLLILAAIVTIYIVLGVLYESYIHPLTILSTLPSAGVGAVLALHGHETDFTLLALIGVLLLIGIVKKNAIMMIDFALDGGAQRRPRSRARPSTRHA